MRRSLVVFIAGISAALLLSITTVALAEKELEISADSAIVIFTEGDVKIKGADIEGWKDAEVGTLLVEGDSVRTGKESWAEIGFGDDFVNVVRLEENTKFELISARPVKLGLLAGEIRSLVESLESGTTFEIKTPTAICGARGTGWDTMVDGNDVMVDAFEDEVFFGKTDKEGNLLETITLGSGERAELKGMLKEIAVTKVPPEKIKRWKSWKGDVGERKIINRDSIMKSARDIAAKRLLLPKFVIKRPPPELADDREILEKPRLDPEKTRPIEDAGGMDDRMKQVEQIERMEKIEKIDRIENLQDKMEKIDKIGKPQGGVKDRHRESREQRAPDGSGTNVKGRLPPPPNQ